MLCWFKIWRTHIHADACARDLYHIKLLPSEHFAKAVTNYLHRWWIIRIRNAYGSLKVSCFRNCQWKVWREREDRKHTHIQYLQILIGCLIAFTNSIDTFIHKICINFDMHEQNVQFWVFVMQFSFWYYDDGRNCLCVFVFCVSSYEAFDVHFHIDSHFHLENICHFNWVFYSQSSDYLTCTI